MNTEIKSSQPPSSDLAVNSIGVIRSNALSARTVFDGIAASTMRQVSKQHGPEQVKASATAILFAGMNLLAPSRRLSPEQVPMLADEIFSGWANESLEDINVFVRGVGTGKYEGSAIYSVVDIPRMLDWWRSYLDDKALQLELQAGRTQDMEGQQARDRVANVPGLSDMLSAFRIEERERQMLNSKRARMERLHNDCPKMTDQELRDAWPLYHTAEERSIIHSEASRRGLLGTAVKEAQEEIDRINKAPDEKAE